MYFREFQLALNRQEGEHDQEEAGKILRADIPFLSNNVSSKP